MKPMTQADLRQATSKARQWFERNRRRFRYYLPERDDRTWEEVFDELLNEVETPLHLDTLDEQLRRRTFPVERFKDSVAGGATQPT